MQADTVILTSNNPRGENPGSIIADVIAGYPDELLAYNARQAYSTGFLHDPGRIPMEALEFSWQNCFECASTNSSTESSMHPLHISTLPISCKTVLGSLMTQTETLL